MICQPTQSSVWLQQPRYEAAEADFQCYLNKSRSPASMDNTASSPLVNDIQQIRQQIQTAMNNTVEEEEAAQTLGLEERICHLEKENKDLKLAVEELRILTSALNTQLKFANKNEVKAVSNTNDVTKMEVEATEHSENSEDDMDLFGSDEETEEQIKEREERVRAYQVKKSKKPALIAKSSITLDVKPWDDETDMAKMEECVRSIKKDGLVWGASKLAPLAYGINKLTILCVVEDEKVSVDDLEEQIIEFEDYVQSVDIAAFNKI